MRGIGRHVPPRGMQVQPADNTSAHVYKQVWQWVNNDPDAPSGALIHTESAREIAAWFAGPDFAGILFERFDSTGTITEELGPEIDKTIREWIKDAERPQPVLARDDHWRTIAALRALRAYIDACDVTVWRVTLTADSLSLTPSPVVVVLVLTDDSRKVVDALRDHFDEWAGGEWPEGCSCTAAENWNDENECDRCNFDAHSEAWLADDFGEGRTFTYQRDDAVSLPSWQVERVTVRYGDAYGSAEASAS